MEWENDYKGRVRRMWVKVLLACLKVHHQLVQRETEETMKIFFQQPSDRECNAGPPVIKSRSADQSTSVLVSEIF
jgi:hypothetical protein